MSLKRMITGSIGLVFIIVFFSGLFAAPEWGALRALDFNTILGTFGRAGVARVVNIALPETVAVTTPEDAAEDARAVSVNLAGPVTFNDFRGTGGAGARDGFMFALTLFPAIILALGCVKVVEFMGALDVAELLLRPLLKPLMGIPGTTGIALIASLQSTDAGASVTKQLADNKMLTKKETLIFTAFQFSAGAPIANYFASGAALFPFLGGTAIMVPFGMMLVFKVFGANLLRIFLVGYKDEEGAKV